MNQKEKVKNDISECSHVDDNRAILEHIRNVSRQRASGDYDNMLPKVSMKIPASVVISCPMARQYLSQARQCISCCHFKGIVQTTFNDENPMRWDSKYAISCGFPVDRKCSSVCVGEN